MNRTIKFRGISIDTGKWIYGYVALDSSKENAVIIHKQANNEMQHTAVIPESVGQFIGIYDKNSIEIYEFDVVRFWTSSTIKRRNGITEVVQWDINGAWLPFNDGSYIEDERGDWFETSRGFEVIGNVIDNPELLKP